MFASDLSDAEQESLLSFMDSGKSYLEQHDHTEAMAKKLMDATLIFTQHLHKVETCSVSTQTEIVSTFDNECQTTAKWVALDKSVAPPVTTQQMPSNTDSLMSSTDSNVMRNSSSKLKKKLPYQSMPSLSPYADMTDVNRLEAEAKKINVSYHYKLDMFKYSYLIAYLCL